MASLVVNVISESSSESQLVNVDMIDTEESVPQFSNINPNFVRSNAPVDSLLQMVADNGDRHFNIFLRSTECSYSKK